VEEIVRRLCNADANAMVEAITSAVKEHSAGRSAFDDETIVVLKVKKQPDGQSATIETARKRRKTSRSLRDV
jgi:hypothetical protein